MNISVVKLHTVGTLETFLANIADLGIWAGAHFTFWGELLRAAVVECRSKTFMKSSHTGTASIVQSILAHIEHIICRVCILFLDLNDILVGRVIVVFIWSVTVHHRFFTRFVEAIIAFQGFFTQFGL